jgi:hypothetical protein
MSSVTNLVLHVCLARWMKQQLTLACLLFLCFLYHPFVCYSFKHINDIYFLFFEFRSLQAVHN